MPALQRCQVMATIVTHIWTEPDGTRTARYQYPAVNSDAEVWRLVRLGQAEARRSRGTDVVVLIGDDLTWKTTDVIRPST
jgi:hypothetical protein